MNILSTHINWFAVLACGVAYMIVGFLWYGPLFANTWMKLIDKSQKDLEKMMKEGRMPKIYGTSFITALITAYVLNILIVLLNVVTVESAVMLGILLWLGLVAAPQATLVLYEDRPFRLYAINIGYYLVTIVISSVILTLWV